MEHGEGDRGFGKSGQWNMERVIEALENQVSVSGTWGG